MGDIASNLIMYLAFDEGSGTSTADSSGNGNTGTLSGSSGGVTWVTGKVGTNAVHFTAAGDHVITTLLTTHNATRSYAFWFKPTTGNVTSRVFDKRDNGDTQVENMLWESSGTGTFTRNWSGGQADWTWTVPTDIAWHHYAITYDSGNVANDPIVYVDGSTVSVANPTGNPSGTANTNSSKYYIGNRGALDRGIGGDFDEFRVYNRILAQADVTDLVNFTGGGGGTTPLTFTATDSLAGGELL